MAEVRKIESGIAGADDFTPSEMFIVVLDQEDTAILCKYALPMNNDKQQAFKSIINGSFFFLKELVD